MSTTTAKNGKNGKSKTTAVDGYSRADGWFNALSGHGVADYSKSENSQFELDILDDESVEALWRGDDLAARIIEDLPQESFRPGWTLTIPGNKDKQEDIEARAEELGFTQAFIDAKEKERAYGGAAIFPVINDGNKDLSKPLNEERISEIEHMLVLEPRELMPQSYYSDIRKAKFARPETYLLQANGQGGVSVPSEPIHESRLIIFYGRRMSRNQQSYRESWGDSVMNRVWRVLRDYNISWASASELLNEFATAVFKIKGLAELIAQDKDEVIKARIRAVQLSRSAIRATMMDAEEEFERKQTPVTGMHELLEKFNVRLAAAADMPVTRLMGQSPAGMNATGESDTRFYYDRIAADRSRRTYCQLERGCKLLLLEKAGAFGGKEPKQWSCKFNSLWQPSQKEEIETRKTQADADNIYIQAGVLNPAEVAEHRFGGDQYSYELQIDVKEREKLAKEMDTPQPGDEELAKEMGMGPKQPDAEQQKPADAAMNGAQIKSLMDIVSKVAAGEISRQSGVALIQVAFPTVNKSEAVAVLGPENFEPKKQEPPQGFPPGVGGKQPKPGEEPPDDGEESSDGEGRPFVRADKIEEHDGEFWVLSADGTKVLGKHPTMKEARRQLIAIEASKHRADGPIRDKLGRWAGWEGPK